ncbi:MAG: tetratricopeptide repeat protein [Candidatus Eisenbacteria bacterium]
MSASVSSAPRASALPCHSGVPWRVRSRRTRVRRRRQRARLRSSGRTRRFLARDRGGETSPRFRILDGVREVARAKSSRREWRRRADRHAEYYLQLATRWSGDLATGDPSTSLRGFDQDALNFDAALERLLELAERGRSARERSGAASRAVGLLSALAEYWTIRGRARDGERALEAILDADLGLDSGSRALACYHAGLFAMQLSQFANADRRLREARERFTALGDEDFQARTLKAEGVAAFDRGRLEDAEAKHRQALALQESMGDQRAIAHSIQNIGNTLNARGELAAAQEHFERSLSLKRQWGTKRDLISTLMGLGNLAERAGRLERAVQYHTECLALATEIGDDRARAMTLANLGSVTSRTEDARRGAELLLESAELHERVGSETFAAHSLVMLSLVPAAAEHAEWLLPILSAGRAVLLRLGVQLASSVEDELDQIERHCGAVLGEARALALSASAEASPLGEAIGRARHDLPARF